MPDMKEKKGNAGRIIAPAEAAAELGQDVAEQQAKPSGNAPHSAAGTHAAAGGVGKGVIAILIVIAAGYLILAHGSAPAPTTSTVVVTSVPLTTSVAALTTFASTTTQQTTAPTTTITPTSVYLIMYVNDYRITPPKMTVRPQTTLTLDIINNGTILHDVEFTGFPVQYVGTTQLKPGQNQTISFTVNATGTYPYYSDIDGQRNTGLTGNLIVTTQLG